MLLHRAALGTVWFDERLAACADWVLWLRLAEQHHLAYLDEALADIRVPDRNMTLDASRMYESSLQVRELLVRRGRASAITSARTAHHEYAAGNIATARKLYGACMPPVAINLSPAHLTRRQQGQF